MNINSSNKTYTVFSGEYPFDNYLGVVEAEDELQALEKALNKFGNHCVVELCPKSMCVH